MPFDRIKLKVHTRAMLDSAYLLFLEPPSEDVEAQQSLSQRVLDYAIRAFQGHPKLMHVELLLPPSPTEQHLLHFATYIGSKSGWQLGHANNVDYYLRGENAGRWRAVPCFGVDAVARIRQECEMERGVAYSLARYASSVYPFRALSSLLPAERRTAAHCATLTARILKNALGDASPVNENANWYAPSTLYHAVASHAAAVSAAWPVDALDDKVSQSIERLLRSPETPATVAEVGDEACAQSVRALTLRVCSELQGGDPVSNALVQRQLATALLRWTILRDSESGD